MQGSEIYIMPTIIDSMTGVKIKSPFFDTGALLELFPVHTNPKKNRVALIYGSNGSGKSTIAQGFREYAESIVPRTVELTPTAGASMITISPGVESEKIFVFDEKYISRNIQVQKSGLGTIVLFGKQVDLEKRLDELNEQIAKIQSDIDSKSENVQKFNSASDVVSPEYWKNAIISKLQSPGGWAETSGIRIKRKHIKTRVTDTEVERLGQLNPRNDIKSTSAEFNKLFNIFNNIDASAIPVSSEIQAIDLPEKVVVDTQRLLAKIPQKPTLTEREQKLLQFFGIEVLSNAKGFLSAKTHAICPTCLQLISEEHRTESLRQIEDILNREVEEYREQLKKLILPEIESEHYQSYGVLDSELMGQVILQITCLNAFIVGHNKVIQNKITDPLSPVECGTLEDLITAYKQLNNLLGKLESKREAFNQVVANRRTTEKELLKLNDEIAHYVIYTEYQSLQSQRTAKQIAEDELHQLRQTKEDLIKEQTSLNAQRKNLQIAVEQINKALSYIFYSDSRLRLYLESDQMYHLKVNEKDVSPDNISCGERNALALCYFFSEIAKETELQKLYCDEMLVVIDDPVSSFDVENRIGILSFLRYKLSQILSSCATTKVLMMSHDMSVIFDLQKAMDEISSNCAGIGKHAEYYSFQLVDKEIIPFKFKSHNEYTRLMNCVYEYGCNPEPAAELTIGNMTRRVLEAFSTFTFKEGPDKVSLNPQVLALIQDPNKRTYFQNSMYRLVLNTESHSQENIQGAPEMSFFSHLTIAEKQRTARDVLCFMYCVNPTHVLSHLPNAKKELDNWMASIV